MCCTVFVGVACVRLSISTAGTKVVYEADMHDLIEAENNNAKSFNRVVVSSGAPYTRAYGRPYGGVLMEPPGGTHTTTDVYSKLSADPTIYHFRKLRIKSEKVDA